MVDIEEILEFDKIKRIIAGYSVSELGKYLAESLKPTSDISQIERMLDICSEAKEISIVEGGLPLSGLQDIRSIMEKASVSGAVLEPQELLRVLATVSVARNVKDFGTRASQEYPLISEIIGGISSFPELEESIARCIDPEGNILDTASRELSNIRRQLVTVRGRVTRLLESIIHSPQYQTTIQEGVITLRNDRYVIPVKQSFRSNLPGVVQARSASGVTLFIEPIEAVELNNQLHELSNEEKREIRRILRALTDKVRDSLEELSTTVQVLAELDLINAKALFCIKLGTTRPQLNDRGYINLIQARHPLLQIKLDERAKTSSITGPNAPKGVVPIDFHIGDGFDTLVITGPNTGGKTVTLKTIGLLTLMMQSGLHIPANEGSQMSVFRHIFADIGDEQSIEQNLSTFSSHMTRIINIIEQLDNSSLVLLDELGAGTEPSEGAALGMAILDYLHSQGAITVATTHHDSLKAHAYSRSGMENASVTFDSKTLEPTYELKIGMPGSSNALKIADRLGLPKKILETAKSYLGPETLQMSDLISTVEEIQRELEEQRRLAEEKALSAHKAQQEHEQILGQLKRKRKELEREALNEASRIIQSAKNLVENTIAELHRENASTESIRRARQTLAKAREEITTAMELADGSGAEFYEDRIPNPDEMELGMEVYVKSLRCHGVLASLPDAKNMVQVRAGNARINVSLSEIRSPLDSLAEDKNTKSKDTSNPYKIPLSGEPSYPKKSGIPSILNLRGYRTADALARTDKYLDDAALAGLTTVSIVHGTGTGALRNAIAELLSKHPQVASFRPGNHDEGGRAVTVVELR